MHRNQVTWPVIDACVSNHLSKLSQPLLGRINMSYFESILEHNKDLAAQQSAAGAVRPSLPRALPDVKAIIIGCADMREDPAHVFELDRARPS